METEAAIRKVIREKLSILGKDKLKKLAALAKSLKKKKTHAKK
jgi:hypothetical protein